MVLLHPLHQTDRRPPHRLLLHQLHLRLHLGEEAGCWMEGLAVPRIQLYRNYNTTYRLFKWNDHYPKSFTVCQQFLVTGSDQFYLLILHGSWTSQTVGPGPAASAPRKREASQAAAGARKKTTTAADYEDLYAIDTDRKIDCLRTMDRVQWNVTITNQMDNADCTEA